MPAFSSVGYQALQDLRTIGVASLPQVDPRDHKIRELPKIGESLDYVPSVLYTPHGPTQSDAAAFDGTSGRIYSFEVCIVAGREGDFGSDQKSTQTLHEQLIRGIERTSDEDFRTELPNCPTVWSVEIDSAPTFDRSKLNDNYAYLSVLVRVRSME